MCMSIGFNQKKQTTALTVCMSIWGYGPEKADKNTTEMCMSIGFNQKSRQKRRTQSFFSFFFNLG